MSDLAIDGLPPLRETIETYGLLAKKSLGQNFLLDLNLTGRIARNAGDLSKCDVLEIGPGPGGLTRAMLHAGARRVVAIERDARCMPALQEITEHYDGRLEVIEADAMRINPREYFPDPDVPVRIIANLPYNIGTALLTNWLDGNKWPPFWQSLTLMFQREVAQRIVADVNTNAYGRLSILTQWRSDARILFDIDRQAFFPPPKVTSSVVHITPKAPIMDIDQAALSRLTAAGFGQRRKMLRQSLKPLGGAALLERANIDPTRRAETLTVQEFCELAKIL